MAGHETVNDDFTEGIAWRVGGDGESSSLSRTNRRGQTWF